MTGITGLPLPIERYPQHFALEEAGNSHLDWPRGGPGIWGDRCCGIACLRMLLRYYGQYVPSQHRLLWEGITGGAYTESGWLHHGLVEIGAKYGLEGFATGYRDQQPLEKLASEGIPSIVSCTFKFPEDGRKGGHLVIFAGSFNTSNGWRIGFADPSRWGATNRSVPAIRFWSSWTGRAIILTPRSWR